MSNYENAGSKIMHIISKLSNIQHFWSSLSFEHINYFYCPLKGHCSSSFELQNFSFMFLWHRQVFATPNSLQNNPLWILSSWVPETLVGSDIPKGS